MSVIKDVPDEGWKALATCGIWLGVGLCAAFGVHDVKEVAGAAGLSTVILWIFG